MKKNSQVKALFIVRLVMGPLFKDKRVAVIGGGNSALEAAIEMEGIASEVHIVSIDEWNGDDILQDKVSSSSVQGL